MEQALAILAQGLSWAADHPVVLAAIIAGTSFLVALPGAWPSRRVAPPGDARDPDASTRKLDRAELEEALAADQGPPTRDPEASTKKLPRDEIEAALAEQEWPPTPLSRPDIDAAPAEPEPEAAPAEVEEKPPKAAEPAGPPVRLRDRLRRTHDTLVGRLGTLVGGRQIDAELLDELETILFSADLGVKTAESLMAKVRGSAGADAGVVRGVLRDAIFEKLRGVELADAWELRGSPHVIVVLGVNGSGKTTTIGKLAAQHAARGRKVILGAGDTFRAAAIEQLEAWAERVGCEVVAGQPGGDPTAVAFDTVKAARARGADVAIIDTAGRLQTRRPLMEELGKLVRVVGREIEGAPHETLLVLDSNTGQNAISQARLFTEAAGVTGLVLTKLDGTAKGGVVVGLADEFGIPVRAVGVGEAVDDLRDFSAEEFVEAVFEE